MNFKEIIRELYNSDECVKNNLVIDFEKPDQRNKLRSIIMERFNCDWHIADEWVSQAIDKYKEFKLVEEDFRQLQVEMDFRSPKHYQQYLSKLKTGKMKKTTKITIGGKPTTAGEIDKELGINQDEPKSDKKKVKKDDEEENTLKTKKRKNPARKLTKKQLKQQAARDKFIKENSAMMLKPRTLLKGAGANTISPSDAISYAEFMNKVYVEGDPVKTSENIQKEMDNLQAENEKEIGKKTEEEYDQMADDAIDEMTPKPEDYPKVIDGKTVTYKEAYAEFKRIKDLIAKKGGPPSSAVTGDYPDDMVYPEGHPKAGQPHPNAGKSKADVRFKALVKLYLKEGGRCPITGEKIELADMELDHIVSLDNGGKDEPENWMFTKAEVNQFKGANSDEKVQSKLMERNAMTEEELESEEADNDYKQFTKQQNRDFWLKKIQTGQKPTLTQVENMSKAERDAYMWAHNKNIDNKMKKVQNDPKLSDEQKAKKIKKLKKKLIPRNKSRTTVVTLPNGDKVDYTYTRGGHVRPDPNIPETWGAEVDEDGNVVTDRKKLSKEAREIQDEVKKIMSEPGFDKLSKTAQAKKLAKVKKRAKDLHKSKRGSGGQGLSAEEQIEVIQENNLTVDGSKASAIADETLDNQREKVKLPPKDFNKKMADFNKRLERHEESIKKNQEVLNDPNSTDQMKENARIQIKQSKEAIKKDVKSQHPQVRKQIKKDWIEKSKAHKSKTTSRQRKGRVKVKVDAWKEKNKDPKDNIKNKKIYPKGKKDPKYIADKEKYDNDLDKFERDAWRDDIKKFPKDKK